MNKETIPAIILGFVLMSIVALSMKQIILHNYPKHIKTYKILVEVKND